MKKIIRLMTLGLLAGLLSACVLTKLVTVPMRVGGAAVSMVPGVGNTAHDAIDTAADKVDDLPI